MHRLPCTTRLRQRASREVTRRAWGLSFALGCLLSAPEVRAQAPETTAPFRIHGFDANVSLRGARDAETSRSAAGLTPLSQVRPVFEQEFALLTHNSIYHPYFLSLDLGAGVTLVQESYRSGEQRRSEPTRFWSAIARARLLEQKPYPLDAYYERTRHGVPLGLTERFFTTDTQYGAHFSLLPAASPIPLRIDATKQRLEGEGFRQIAREEIGHLGIASSRRFDGHGQLGLSYQAHEVRSANGSTEADVLQTHSVTHTAEMTSSASIGRRLQLEIEAPASWYQQNEAPHREIVRVAPQVRYRPWSSLQITGRYRADRVRTLDMASHTDGQEADLAHQLFESVTTNLHVHSRVNRTDGIRDARQGGSGGIAYRKRTFFGGIGLSYARSRESLDRRGAPTTIAVFGESFALRGLAAHELMEDNVVSGSVVVWNAGRTRQFVEGIDYRVAVAGVRTRIERLPAGAILDGEGLSVDYRIDFAGRVAYVADDNSIGTTVTVKSWLSASARFRKAPRHLREGMLSQPLNSSEGETYGAQLNLPWRHLELEANAELEHRREEIAPYNRRGGTASLAMLLAGESRLTLTAERVKTDNLRAGQDVNLTALAAVCELRPTGALHLSLSAHDDQDIGSTQPRRLREVVARGEWRVRRLSANAEFRSAREEQGSYARTRTSLRAELTREFAR